jgi:hypothetical protein
LPTAPLKVFITGASSGLGAALARHYGARGARLGLAGRRLEGLQDTAAGLDARLYQADVRDAAAMQAAADAFLNEAGPPDVVIAAAGISVGTLTEAGEDARVFRAVMDANVLGLVHTFQPFIAAMQTNGVLCGISSVAGVRGLPGGGAYSASKAAATVYLEALRLDESTRHRRRHRGARLHRHADDAGESVCHAIQDDGTGSGRQGGALHRAPPRLHRHSLADGLGGAIAEIAPHSGL